MNGLTDAISHQHTPPVSFDADKARLLSAGRVHADVTWTIPSHAHINWEFIYFVRGTGRIDVPEGTLRPQAYHLVVYPPGLAHSEMSSPIDPEETIYFGVDVPGSLTSGTHLILPDPQGEIGWLCERIVAEYESYGKSKIALAYVRAFLHVVERVAESGVLVPHDIVDLAVQYMFANYGSTVTLRSLAEELHVSESHLAHQFSSKLGISPLRYLQHIRLESAKRLLTTTKLSIGEIAAQVGFPDPLYFSRAFRRATGYAPSDFRARSKSAI